MAIHKHPRRFATTRASLRSWVTTCFIVVPWLLLFAQAYVSFTFPIKQDRYKHSFFRHISDRLAAYLYLTKSSSKFENAELNIEKINRVIEGTAARHAVDPCLVQAIVIYESAYDANTITTTGAMGLMALMPATAKNVAIADPFDPVQNIEGGTRLVYHLLAEFKRSVDLALAAYNSGERAVVMVNGVPPYQETLDYVKHVKLIWNVCTKIRNPQ